MSHPEQLAFLALVAAVNAQVVDGGRILEIGSYDVNGTVRRQFGTAREYVGVDLADGPGVDRVVLGHEVDDADGSFDVTLSGECFEHDPHWRQTFANMVRLTRPGGLVTFTCASIGRPEHGTSRTDPAMSPGTQAVGLDYYRNLGPGDFDDFPLDEWFDNYSFWYLPTSLDLYFAGVRTCDSTRPRASLPHSDAVERLAGMMPWGHRLVRWPFRLATRHGEGAKFQDRALVYWRTVLRIGGLASSAAPKVFGRNPDRG